MGGLLTESGHPLLTESGHRLLTEQSRQPVQEQAPGLRELLERVLGEGRVFYVVQLLTTRDAEIALPAAVLTRESEDWVYLDSAVPAIQFNAKIADTDLATLNSLAEQAAAALRQDSRAVEVSLGGEDYDEDAKFYIRTINFEWSAG